MKPLMLTALLAFAAPSADAGDVSIDLGFRHHGKRVRIKFGKRDTEVQRRGRDRIQRRRRRSHAHRVWVPVRYETVRTRVWVRRQHRRQYVPAVYRTRYDRCGYAYRVLVRNGYWTHRHIPGHFEFRVKRVRRGGYYEVAGHRPQRHRQRHRA